MSVPDRIGQYDVEALIGAGGFATVWLAYNEGLRARVAIKVLAENWSQNLLVRERFITEAQILWLAGHNRIVRVHDVGELPDGRPYFVMDWADRGSLRKRMAERLAGDAGGFSPEEAVGYACEIAECLTVVHALGYIHRDVNPNNVLIRSLAPHQRAQSTPGAPAPEEQVVLADFGLAKELALTSCYTGAAGTPAYMAPEQLCTGSDIDSRVDVFALMAVTHELVFGSVPNLGTVGDGRPPDQLQAAIARGLDPDPDRRYASAGEAAAALTAALDRDSAGPGRGGDQAPARPAVLAHSQAEPAGPTQRSRRRLPLAVALILGVAVAAAVLAGAASRVALGSRRPPHPRGMTGSTSTTGLVLNSPLPKGVVLEDRFSQAGTWPQVDDDKHTFGYTEGQYRMVVRDPSKAYTASAPTVAPSGGNIRVEVDATKLTDVAATFGVSCRVGPVVAGAAAAKYVAAIDTNGSWRMLRYQGGPSSPQTLAAAANRSEYSNAVRSPGPNLVALECIGGDAPGAPVMLRLSLNGQLVKEATDPNGLGAGTVGLAVLSSATVPVEVRFDNLVATRL